MIVCRLCGSDRPFEYFRYEQFYSWGAAESCVVAAVADGVSSPYPVRVSERLRRGRPRSEQAHQAILATARTLLIEQGLPAMTLDRVAREAHVAKTTIYR